MREFKKVGSGRALDVGYQNRGTGTFKVRKPKVPEGCPEVIVRENSVDMTLKAEEVGKWKALVNVNHIEKERWSSTLVDYDWYAFCWALSKASMENWENVFSHKEMSRAVGVKKPQEAQKAKTLWNMKAAKAASEECYHPDGKDNILRRNETRLALWEKHLKDTIVALDKSPEVRGNSVLKLTVGSRLLWHLRLQ